MLAEDEVYLNSGTYSAVPRPVYDEVVRQLALCEKNPTRIGAWRGRKPLWDVQTQIARYVGADPTDFVFHINVTHAMNQALFGYQWTRRGEFIASRQEYGAVTNAAREMARRNSLSFRVFDLPQTPQSEDELCDAVMQAADKDTVGVLLSHVISWNGTVMPVKRIAPMLRKRDIRFFVDGAHAPGLIPLNLGATEVDFYGGNLHKWFMGPKGTGFLYAARSMQEHMEPSVVGWGGTPHDSGPVHEDGNWGAGRRFQHVFRLQGLMDCSPFLALPATLEFRQTIGEDLIRARIGELVRYTRHRLGERLGLRCLSGAPDVHAGLVQFRAPETWQQEQAQEKMFTRYRITVPIGQKPHTGMTLRVSPHIWNSEADIDRLAEALSAGP
jgi:isopenicillin-N epimerase